ncbi:MAG: hypothetical protein AVDCRST_MAG25-1091 [uncultured Rubrobacteraceae bacterium]|uniref:HTH marR-type domain-containing protein n=1 Tax=uncultured Rubrobacteraceae bacterium TaxID=349277 RepID=A0A6J4RB43_9ACTN|nr:MAG: hypothetical protein AVDCRST_MAG25-1091 [uncultured Rubrobacteraceae bacterium]
MGCVFRRVGAVYEKETGFGVGQWFVLVTLERRDGVSQGEMSRMFGVDPARVSRVGRALEKEGLVRRERDPGDGRVMRLYLTEAGRKAIEQRAAVDEAVEARVRRVMSEEEVEELGRMLGLLADAMEE